MPDSRQNSLFILFFIAFFFVNVFLIWLFSKTFLSSLPNKFEKSLTIWYFYISLALLSTGVFYIVLKEMKEAKEKIENAMMVAGPTLPFLLAEFCCFIIGLYYWEIPLFSAISFFAFILLLVVAFLTFQLFIRINPSRRSWASFVFFILLILSPFYTSLFSSRPATFDINLENVEHPIQKVILISIDTLRADALSCYDSNGVATPHIDQLAEDSILFQNAISNAPWTLPSLISIMTGLSPSVHRGIRFHSKLHENLPTLAEKMLENGYYTGAIGNNHFLNFGFSRGFIESDFYPHEIIQLFPYITALYYFPSILPKHMNSMQEVSTERLTQLTVDWLKTSSNKDFFFWLHYYDPHTPYSPPKQYLKDLTPEPRIGMRFNAKKMSEFDGSNVPTLSTAEIEWIKTLYHAEVRYVDDNIGELMGELKRLGIYEDSLIILTSDHGEEFAEHTNFGHINNLHKELVWIPLIIKLPQSVIKGRVETRVSTQCLYSSILQLCGIDYEIENPYIQPLPPFWERMDSPPEGKAVFSEGLHEKQDSISVTNDNLKYIRSPKTNREILLDLKNDPGEHYPLRISESDKIDDLRTIMDDFLAITEQIRQDYSMQDDEVNVLSESQEQQLRAMGYIQ